MQVSVATLLHLQLPLRFSSKMVTTARLSWITHQMQAGRQCRCRINSNAGQVTIHIVLTKLHDPSMLNLFAIGLVQTLAQSEDQFITVDHGHQNSAGESHCSIVFKNHIRAEEVQVPVPMHQAEVVHSPEVIQQTGVQHQPVEQEMQEAAVNSGPDIEATTAEEQFPDKEAVPVPGLAKTCISEQSAAATTARRVTPADIERLNRQFPFVFLAGQARVDAELSREAGMIDGTLTLPWLSMRAASGGHCQVPQDEG